MVGIGVRWLTTEGPSPRLFWILLGTRHTRGRPGSHVPASLSSLGWHQVGGLSRGSVGGRVKTGDLADWA